MWAWFWFIAFICAFCTMLYYRWYAEELYFHNGMLAQMIREERDKHKEVE